MTTSEERAAAVTEKSEAHKELARKAQDLKDTGYSNVEIARRLGTSESNVRTLLKTKDGVLPVGSTVKFDDEGVMQYGTILDHIPLEDGSVSYHIACYHTAGPGDVERTEDDIEVEYATPWTPPEPNAMAPYAENTNP